jgi:hypothetical protein
MSRRCSQHSYFPGIVHRILLPPSYYKYLAFASQLITVHCFARLPPLANHLLTVGVWVVVGVFLGGGVGVVGVCCSFQLLVRA